jgi:hypothetical protein
MRRPFVLEYPRSARAEREYACRHRAGWTERRHRQADESHALGGSWMVALYGRWWVRHDVCRVAFDDAGKFLATQRVRAAFQLNATLDGFTGPFTADFIGADGQVLASTSGTVQDTRIGLFGGLLPAAAAREIFADPAANVAGSLAPTGVARAVAGGYQLSGRRSFGSGIAHNTWALGGCRVLDGMRPA